MKLVYSFIFSFLSLAGIWKDFAVYLTFKANQEYIVVELCEEKEEIENTCQGSCYLSKKLKQVQEEEQDSNKQAPPKLKTNITLYLVESFSDIKPSYSEQYEQFSSLNLKTKINKGHPDKVFQPPKV